MTSLRQTVMLYVTVLLVIVGVTAAATSSVFVRYEVNRFQDTALQEVALNAGLIYRHEIQPRIDADVEDRLVVQIWDHAGRVLHRSGPPADLPQQARLGYNDVTAGGENWRVFRANDPQHAVQISQRWSAREDVAAYAAAGAAVPLLAAIPLAWLLIAWAVKRVLTGLGELSIDIGQRSLDAKDALGLAGVPSEIAPLVGAMNALIERHQHALDLQRRFVSDAAHELRTPLAALQIQIDNLGARELAGTERGMAADLLAGIRRAAHTANQLLTMARADALLESRSEIVDVGALLRLLVAGSAPVIEAKAITTTIDVADHSRVMTRAADLQLVLSNLIDNAVRYTQAGGEIIVRASSTIEATVIAVIDDGPGIPVEALPKIFDRFFRAAPQDSEGTGLGLSIAKAAADRNGIAIRIANRPDASGLTATVTVPITEVSTGVAPTRSGAAPADGLK
ncbi:MAG: two-component sensor histidine kinase [Tardiphaga sp.]|nr:two-component sensor histidine kinase [Tardiphaga sp.]